MHVSSSILIKFQKIFPTWKNSDGMTVMYARLYYTVITIKIKLYCSYDSIVLQRGFAHDTSTALTLYVNESCEKVRNLLSIRLEQCIVNN